MMQRNSLKKEHPETYRRPKSKNKRCMWAGKHRNSASISIFSLERVGLSVLFATEILLLLQTGEPLGTVMQLVRPADEECMNDIYMAVTRATCDHGDHDLV